MYLFLRFPKDLNIKYMWLRAIGRGNHEPTGNDYICSEHFSNRDLIRINNKTLLKKDAVPSRNLNLNIIMVNMEKLQ